MQCSIYLICSPHKVSTVSQKFRCFMANERHANQCVVAAADDDNPKLEWNDTYATMKATTTTTTSAMKNHLHNFVSTREEPLIFRFGMNAITNSGHVYGLILHRLCHHTSPTKDMILFTIWQRISIWLNRKSILSSVRRYTSISRFFFSHSTILLFFFGFWVVSRSHALPFTANRPHCVHYPHCAQCTVTGRMYLFTHLNSHMNLIFHFIRLFCRRINVRQNK